MKKEEILTELLSTKTANRKKAAKEIAKQNLKELGLSLFNAYCNEKNDNRSWETKVEMILALGFIDYKPAITKIETIIKENNPHDMITYAAGQTYVRLKRQSLSDAKCIIKIMEGGGLSLVDGLLVPLGHDKMMPPKDEIIELIKLAWDFHEHKDRVGHEYGYADPRYGLALACAGWDKELTTSFLNHCIATSGKEQSIRKVSEGALKGKYVKTR